MPTRRHKELGSVVAVLMIVAAGPLFSGCKSKKKDAGKEEPQAPSVSGLAAVPADATAVIGFDAAKLRSSRLVQRAVEQMFIRDPDLRGHMRALFESCKFEPKRDLSSLVVALRTGTDALMVAEGRFQDDALATCVHQSLEKSGGVLTSKKAAGRTMYRAQRGDRDVWFVVAGPSTLAVATSEAWLTAAVGQGPKVRSNPEMKALLDAVNVEANVWAAGKVPPEVAAGMAKSTAGSVPSGPRAIVAQLDLAEGFSGTLGAKMDSPALAKSLKSFISTQLEAGSLLLAGLQVGPFLRKVRVDSEGATVYLRVSLSAAELQKLLSQLTGGGPKSDPKPGKSPR